MLIAVERCVKSGKGMICALLNYSSLSYIPWQPSGVATAYHAVLLFGPILDAKSAKLHLQLSRYWLLPIRIATIPAQLNVRLYGCKIRRR